ncbi:cyclic nucleotide-binding domain-containing protein [Myxococcota bacterium]|nr:cyclic nucleotide-binding domain-containing protein [Myxococcota bacterium]MBU1533817.1 cyclic nucleotide-binding domain-containing protein [Myxococcota bacterium]
MNLNEASEVMQLVLYNRYGTFLTLGEVGVIRRAEGRRWGAKVYLFPESEEPIFVGIIETDPYGNLTEMFTKADLVDKIRSAATKENPTEDDFGDFFLDDEESQEEEDPNEIRNRIDSLLEQATKDSLDRARGLYPLLLKDPSTRGAVLHEMGLLELAMENNDLALEYLEAAAREYSNLAKVELIFKIADRVERLIGAENFENHAIYRIMRKTVGRMESIDSLAGVKVFAGLPENILEELEARAELIKLDHGDVIIKEGDPAVNVVIIKKGLLDVVLEDFGDEPKTIRSCFPGDFLGENSVLSPPGSIQATASLISSRSNTTVWRFRGEELQELMGRIPELAVRIRSLKVMHQLDSFFSMHPSMQDLEVKDRDEILKCMTTIMTVQPGDILADNEEIPENVYLIMAGTVEYQFSSGAVMPFGADHFVCMRDALHGIAVDGQYVATEEATVVVFDSDKLRNFAVGSTAAVVAILERLN